MLIFTIMEDKKIIDAGIQKGLDDVAGWRYEEFTPEYAKKLKQKIKAAYPLISN